LMTRLAEGDTENAYRLAENSVIIGLRSVHALPGSNDQQRSAIHAFSTGVTAFYREHPDRRKALAEQPYRDPDLLKWIDGGS
jgi:hypothetical protein